MLAVPLVFWELAVVGAALVATTGLAVGCYLVCVSVPRGALIHMGPALLIMSGGLSSELRRVGAGLVWLHANIRVAAEALRRSRMR